MDTDGRMASEQEAEARVQTTGSDDFPFAKTATIFRQSDLVQKMMRSSQAYKPVLDGLNSTFRAPNPPVGSIISQRRASVAATSLKALAEPGNLQATEGAGEANELRSASNLVQFRDQHLRMKTPIGETNAMNLDTEQRRFSTDLTKSTTSQLIFMSGLLGQKKSNATITTPTADPTSGGASSSLSASLLWRSGQSDRREQCLAHHSKFEIKLSQTVTPTTKKMP